MQNSQGPGLLDLYKNSVLVNFMEKGSMNISSIQNYLNCNIDSQVIVIWKMKESGMGED